jgi:hypothetical protein
MAASDFPITEAAVQEDTPLKKHRLVLFAVSIVKDGRSGGLVSENLHGSENFNDEFKGESREPGEEGEFWWEAIFSGRLFSEEGIRITLNRARMHSDKKYQPRGAPGNTGLR